MEDGEVEEGEITDSGDEEVGQIKASDDGGSSKSSYVAPDPLPRPNNPAMSYRAPQEPCSRAHTFRESPRFGGDDSDDADSELSDDGGYISGKKRKLHINGSAASSNHRRQHAAVTQVRKRRNIWSDVLVEDSLSSKIQSSGNLRGRAIDTIERGVESYVPSGESRTVDFDEFDAELSEAAARIGADQLWNVNDDGESDNHSTRKRAGKKNGIKHRLDIHPGRGGGGDDDYSDELPAEVCADDDERVIARYIARNLNEPKIVLIERVVRYTSRQKALDLFNRTMDVEAAGGMKTIRGDTRRTPGGVFLQLLKTDKNITKDMVKEIFSLERENQKFAKKMNIKDRQNRKRKYRNKNNTSESLLAPPTDLIDDSDLMGEEPDIEIGVVS